MIDLDGLHALLWLWSRDGVITVHQRQVASELQVNHIVIHRCLRRMVDDGRLTKLSGEGPTPRTYRVTDPADWLASRAPTRPTDDAESSTPAPGG